MRIIINVKLHSISGIILINEQAGFWWGHSCIDDILSENTDTEKNGESNLETFNEHEKCLIELTYGLSHHIHIINSLHYCTTVLFTGNDLRYLD